jgi:hypothetical protein
MQRLVAIVVVAAGDFSDMFHSKNRRSVAGWSEM